MCWFFIHHYLFIPHPMRLTNTSVIRLTALVCWWGGLSWNLIAQLFFRQIVTCSDYSYPVTHLGQHQLIKCYRNTEENFDKKHEICISAWLLWEAISIRIFLGQSSHNIFAVNVKISKKIHKITQKKNSFEVDIHPPSCKTHFSDNIFANNAMPTNHNFLKLFHEDKYHKTWLELYGLRQHLPECTSGPNKVRAFSQNKLIFPLRVEEHILSNLPFTCLDGLHQRGFLQNSLKLWSYV